MPFQQLHFSFQGLQLSYLENGNSGAPPLIFIHGGQEHAHCWEPIAEQFCNDWHVILPDLRGHGKSDWSTGGAYSVVELALDLMALIDHMGLSQVTLVGHSLGGNTAIHYAGLFNMNVRRLCAIEGLGLSPQARRERDETSRITHLRNWATKIAGLSNKPKKIYRSMDQAMQSIMKNDPRMPEAMARQFASYGLEPHAEGGFVWRYDERILVQGAADVRAAEPSDIWSEISCPVLLVYGEESWASNPTLDGRARYFNNARVVTIKDAGHNLHHHQPGQFTTELRRFIA